MHVEVIELPHSHEKRVVINLGGGMEHSVLPEQALQLAQWINELRGQMGLDPVAPNEVLEAYRHDADAIRLQMPPRSWSGTAIMHLWNALMDALRERDLAVAHDRQPYPTAWAYEQLATAHAALRAKLEEAEELRAAALAWAEQLRASGHDIEHGAYYSAEAKRLYLAAALPPEPVPSAPSSDTPEEFQAMLDRTKDQA
jgi:hypothetical protein